MTTGRPSGGTWMAPSEQALARQLVVDPAGAARGPSRRAPTRLTSADTVHVARRELRRASRRRTSRARGPGQTPTTVGRRHRRRRLVDDDRRAGVGADREPRRRPRSRGGPRPERESVAARPEHRLDVDAAAHGEVAPQLARRPARRRRPRRRPTARGASSADVATIAGPDGRRPQPAERLEHGGVGRVADEAVEQVAQSARRGRRSAARRWRRDPGRPASWIVVAQPGSTTTSVGHVAATKRTAVPGTRSAPAGPRSGPTGGRRCADAGASRPATRRVDRAVARRRWRPSRPARGARRRPAGQVQRRVEPREVGEARARTRRTRTRYVGRRVAGDDLVDGEPARVGDGLEVLAVVGHGDLDLVRRRRSSTGVAARPTASQAPDRSVGGAVGAGARAPCGPPARPRRRPGAAVARRRAA